MMKKKIVRIFFKFKRKFSAIQRNQPEVNRSIIRGHKLLLSSEIAQFEVKYQTPGENLFFFGQKKNAKFKLIVLGAQKELRAQILKRIRS